MPTNPREMMQKSEPIYLYSFLHTH